MRCFLLIKQLRAKLANNGFAHYARQLDIEDPFYQPTISDAKQMFAALKIVPTELTEIGRGSHAVVYDVGNGKVLKVTSDRGDANALLKAQRLNSKHIVNVYRATEKGVNGGLALLAEKIEGPVAPYSTSELHALIQGKNFDKPSIARLKILRTKDEVRDKVLDKHGRNTKEERLKLSALFGVIAQLEHLGIDMFDYSENIIDSPQGYVIIDLGQ